jgi:glutamine synthetase
MVLGGMLHGIENRLDPGPVLAGNAYRDTRPTIPLSWPEAIAAFERSDFARRCLGERFANLYALTRRGEMQDFGSYVSPLEFSWYLTTV